jgi:hypothetical protein
LTVVPAIPIAEARLLRPEGHFLTGIHTYVIQLSLVRLHELLAGYSTMQEPEAVAVQQDRFVPWEA